MESRLTEPANGWPGSTGISESPTLDCDRLASTLSWAVEDMDLANGCVSRRGLDHVLKCLGIVQQHRRLGDVSDGSGMNGGVGLDASE